MAERPPGWLLRRLLVVGLAIGVLTVIVVPVLREDTGGDKPDPVCTEAKSRSQSLLAEAADLADDGYTPVLEREAKAEAFTKVEEAAVLVEQNPDCFSPTDRAAVEANYRRWQAAGYG